MRCLTSFTFLFTVLTIGCGVDGRDDAGDPGPDAAPAIQPGWLPTGGTALATDADYLYVGGGAVARVPLTGGALETLFTLPAGGANDIPMVSAIVPGPRDLVVVTSMLSQSGTMKTLVRVPKDGGPATTLATSSDQRAFLGATIDGDDVYFSTFTALYRVPLAGGAPQMVGQSPESVRYWVFSPTILGSTIYWAEDARLFQIDKNDADRKGTQLAELDGVGEIVGVDSKLVVALSASIANQSGAEAFVEVDPATGQTGATIPLGREANDTIATAEAVWAATRDGLVRVPRSGGAPELVTTEYSFVVAASADAVFVAGASGVTRVAR